MQHTLLNGANSFYRGQKNPQRATLQKEEGKRKAMQSPKGTAIEAVISSIQACCQELQYVGLIKTSKLPANLWYCFLDSSVRQRKKEPQMVVYVHGVNVYFNCLLICILTLQIFLFCSSKEISPVLDFF